MTSKILILITICLLPFKLLAQKTNPAFVVEKVSKSVYTAHPGLVDRISSTSSIIMGETYLIVVDPQTDIYMGGELIKAIRRKISTLPIKYLVYTHFHSDHVAGAAAFVKENPSITIIAHEQAKTQIDKGLVAEEKNQLAETIEKIAEKANKEAHETKNEARKKELIQAVKDLDQYYEDTKNSPIIAPTLTLKDTLNLYDGELEINIHAVGTGHTPSDIIIYLPKEKVLLSGDLAHAFEPLFFHADADGWIEVLEKVREYDFDYMIGGHGDFQKGKGTLISWQKYIVELKAFVMEGIQKGIGLKELQSKASPENFASLRENSYGERIQKARTSLISDRFVGSLEDAVKSEVEFLYNYYHPQYSKK